MNDDDDDKEDDDDAAGVVEKKGLFIINFSLFIIFIMTFENLAHFAVHAPMSNNPHNPTVSPHTGTSGQSSHCDNSGKREKRWGSGKEAEK